MAKQRSFDFVAPLKGKRRKRSKSSSRRRRDELAHVARPELAAGGAVHVTLRCRAGVPNLRSRRAFGCVARAFRKVTLEMGEQARLIHFAVLGNHIHLVMEARSAAALGRAVQKLTLSMSRSLNAEAVRRAGGDLDPRHGKWSARRGWIGRVFADRYHRNDLVHPAQVAQTIRYLFSNAQNHYKAIDGVRCAIDLRRAREYYAREEKTADLFPDAASGRARAKEIWADIYTSLGYLFSPRHFGGPSLVRRPKNALIARESLRALKAL